MFKRRPARVLVLGAGPAGLVAAHAAHEAGVKEVVVFSAPGPDGRPAKSALYGCQYLHAPIPGLTAGGPGTPVSYLLEGTADAYRRKVYGAEWEGSVSPDEYGPERAHLAWNLRAAYDELWRKYGAFVVPAMLTAKNVLEFVMEKAHVVSTIPAPVLCLRKEDHKFVTQDVWAMGSAPGRSLPFVAAENTILCNGQDAPRWYRAATVFGHSTLEWPGGVKPPISGVASVRKPLRTDCDCHMSDRWTRAGRYGTWTKGVLVHEVFDQVYGWLK